MRRGGGAAKHPRHWAALTLALLATFITLLLCAPAAHADFGIASFSTKTNNEDGSIDLRAGSHPFSYSFDFALNTDSSGEPEGTLYSLDVDLPPGLIGNPLAVPICRMADFEGGTPQCPINTQVGVIHSASIGLGDVVLPIFNLSPPPGYAAAFAGSAVGNNVFEFLSLQGSGPQTHLQVSAPILPDVGVQHITQTLWGVPADHGHDGERGACLEGGGSCPVEITPAPLLTLPVACDGPLETTLSVASLSEPARTISRTALSLGEGGSPEGLSSCEALPFDPRLTVAPEAQALSPTGLAIDLEQPQAEGTLRAAAALRRLVVHLPPGITLNPPVASGLAACSPEQVGLRSPPGQAPARLDSAPARCPDAAKLGTAEIETPVLDHRLRGSIYLASPGQNPFAARFAIYVVLEDPLSGTVLKFSGHLDADPLDGRLTATVPDLPQLPFGEIELQFHGGPRALLANPPRCGTYTTSADLLPSTAPEAGSVQRNSSFKLSGGPDSGPCPPPESEQPHAPSFEAGTVIPIAGQPSHFVLRLQRADTAQHLSSFELDLPPGLLADLSQTATCPDASIGAAAQANSAAAEQAQPSCPPDSAIGTATIGAGVGSAPLYLTGEVYLSGPYKGAPFSLTAVVPARAGPFDLGTITERVAVDLDPTSAALSARADPLPQIIAGVPLELRSLALRLDRPGFIRNPTSCDPLSITGSSTSTLGFSSPLASRFQVGACAALPFKPRLALRLSGALARNGRPALRAVLRAKPAQANIARAALTLPVTELLDYAHIHAVCAQARYAADGGGGKRCPAQSVYGHARVFSPFLNEPLEGPVYLRSNGGERRLPDLVASLSGPTHLDLLAHLSPVHGLVRAVFPRLPDLPLSRLVLWLRGGRGGLLVNTKGLCRARPRARASFLAHNAKRSVTAPAVRISCDKAKAEQRHRSAPLLGRDRRLPR